MYLVYSTHTYIYIDKGFKLDFPGLNSMRDKFIYIYIRGKFVDPPISGKLLGKSGVHYGLGFST